MHLPGIDSAEPGAPPLRRAATGLLLGVVTGAVAAVLLPAEPRSPAARRPRRRQGAAAR